ncbi:drug/metabolite transporter (DMT)-like permease [Microvirga flocculans]|uniref:Drug/metabolite transporter (DMT)-like permease n=1 Tax=Microvirga flocculans TaxID=217168 RepID=A0A7W6IDC8_9HYPH|nr:DMT family transporter [Microvirga flocculans]MBB4039071.1 drug/metabolite transporter (DMT)-like permease [Microvirga flocculans]
MTASRLSVATESAIALLGICGLLFASRIMMSKMALSAGIQPFQLGAFANLGAGLCLLPWLVVTRQRIPMAPEHLALYGILGIVSFAVPTVLSYFVVDRVGPAYTSIVYCLSPLLTMSFAAGIGFERMFLRRFLGIVLGFVGMIALVQQQILKIDVDQPLWVALGLVIPVCAASGNIVRSAWWPKGTSALAFSCGASFSSAVLVALMAPAFEAPQNWQFDAPAVSWILTMAAMSAASQLMNFRLQQIAGPVVFSQIGYWGTGFGVLLAALLFGDVLTASSFAGLVCIMGGGILANRRKTS